jgi:hypothetical protein
MKQSKLLFLGLLSMFFISCSNQSGDENPVVARVYDKQLRLNELAAAVPAGMNPQDSVKLCKNYIDQWVKRQLKVKKAELFLNPSSDDIQKQLEDYRQSLLIHLYEKEVIRESLDTILADNEIFNYYQLHLEDFILKKDLVKMIYIQLDIDARDYYKFRRTLRYDYPDEMESVYQYCQENATQLLDFNNEWVYFEDAAQLIPNKISNPNYFISNNEYNEIIKDGYRHIVRIYDHKLAGDPSPIDRVWNDISNLILLKRKMELIKDLEQENFDEALKFDHIKIYPITNE